MVLQRGPLVEDERDDVLGAAAAGGEARLEHIGTVYRAEPYEPDNLVPYLVRRTKIWLFLLAVSLKCILNLPNLVLYLVWRTKVVVLVLALRRGPGS